MVGAAVAVAIGVIPIDILRGSLAIPARAALPLAPGTPLALASNQFKLFPRHADTLP